MVSVKWYGINALEFRHRGGSFMIDPYVSRDRERIVVPSEQSRYLTSKPDFVLMTHAHWVHLPDVPFLIRETGTTLYASETACNIMRALGVPEKNLHRLHYGEKLELPGGVRAVALESRHMGTMPENNFYETVPYDTDFSLRENWKCGEVFAFHLEVDGLSIINAGSANLYEPAMKGRSCDWLIYGISRWRKGFPELLMRNLSFKRLIGVHHDEFTRPLAEFRLRDDLIRLAEALQELSPEELPVLKWVELSAAKSRSENNTIG